MIFCDPFDFKMRRRNAKWSPLNFLLIIAAILFSTSAAFDDPKNSDSENQSSRQENYSNSTSTLVSDPTNQLRFKRRWSNTYGTSRVEPRLYFPTFATPRPPPNYGLHFKGYKPSKAPIGYPAARPPVPPYNPQPNRPAQPSHTYGIPKPIGYPASSNYHNHQEVYFTYPPGTSVSYPQTTSNPVGSYGSGYPSGYQSTPPPPNKPNYEVPLSTPNPSYYVTTKPNNYVTTPSTPYPSPNPTYPVPAIGQTTYPGYPASNGGGSYNPPPSSGYPSPGTAAPPKPNYPVHSSSSYPSYPASSGGSYPMSSSVGASHLPIFVFIPKPGYFNTDHNSIKPGNYHKPTPPPHYYPATPVVPQYYPPAQPVKPLKPVGVYYPSAKPPSTAYGLPKPQRPTQQYYPSPQSGSYGNDNPRPSYPNNSPTGTGTNHHSNNQVSNYKGNDDLLTTRKPYDVHHLSADSRPSQPQAHPSVFQRGNILHRPVDSQPTFSAVVSDFISLPDTIQLEGTTGPPLVAGTASSNQNQSWAIGAASSQVVSVTEYPRAAVNHLIPTYQDEFRIPFQSGYPKPPVNDCGGSWVVLQRPTGGFVDPTQVQIEPIRPQFLENSHQFHFKPNDQLFRSPSEVGLSGKPFPLGINEPFVPESISNVNEPSFTPDFLIFSTTPNPELVSTTSVVDSGEWRKPNSLISSFSFKPRDSILVDRAIPSSATGQSFSSGITVVRPDDTTIPAFSSTENSIILSLNAINLSDPTNGIDLEQQSGIKSPSPFLVDISSSDENDSKEVKSINLASDNNVGLRENSSAVEEEDDSDRLSRNLRSANLRVISSLISKAGIASLFQDKDYTLLAPSNAAFNKISAIQRQRWATRPDLLREMLLHHVIPHHFNSSSFENEATPTTLAGAHRLRINIYNATENREETITTVNGARVLTADLRLGKLLVHVIDRVLMPGNFPSQTILDILNDGGLQASLLGPALTKVLSSDSPLSVFVPTTEAFLSVSQDEQRLFLNNETAFHNLLWYHIVPGTYYSEGLEDGQLLSTLHDVGRLRVDLRRQNRKSKLARINGVANVIESDVSASNGVVHFIDRILTDILF